MTDYYFQTGEKKIAGEDFLNNQTQSYRQRLLKIYFLRCSTTSVFRLSINLIL